MQLGIIAGSLKTSSDISRQKNKKNDMREASRYIPAVIQPTG